MRIITYYILVILQNQVDNTNSNTINNKWCSWVSQNKLK